MTARLLLSLAPIAALVVLSTPVSGQEVKALGDFGSWIAYTYQENGQPVCFMSAKPEKSEGDYKVRGEPQLLVSHRPGEKAFDVVSMVAGYQYRPDSDVTVTMGDNRYKMFTNSDRAWASDNQTDRLIVQAMIKGKAAVVRGTSSRNTLTVDTFSLAGFTAAYEAINGACEKP